MSIPQKRVRVAVIGDLMFDVDHEVSYVSEAEGRPKLNVIETVRRIGAAGAVANMVAALGVDVSLYGACHFDDADWVRKWAPGYCFILSSDKQSTTRERFWLDGKAVGPRVDRGLGDTILPTDQRALGSKLAALHPDAIIVCDHAKGVVGSALMDSLRRTGIPIFADGHVRSDWTNFSGIECLCMNRDEALAAVDAQVPVEPKETIQHCDQDGLWWYRAGWWLAKSAPEGESDSHRLWFPSMAGTVVDTLGAGDQFIATLAVWRAKGESWEESILAANRAAGLQCGRRGIVPVSFRDLQRLEAA